MHTIIVIYQTRYFQLHILENKKFILKKGSFPPSQDGLLLSMCFFQVNEINEEHPFPDVSFSCLVDWKSMGWEDKWDHPAWLKPTNESHLWDWKKSSHLQ